MTIRIDKRIVTTEALTVDTQPSHKVSFCVSSENEDATFTVKGRLSNDGTFRLLGGVTIVDGTIHTFDAPLDGLQVDVTNLGTSAYVDVEVLGV